MSTPTTPHCGHTDAAPYRGMRVVETHDDTVTFRCAACLVEHVALRCRGTNADGSRCRGAAMKREASCRMHRLQVRLAEAEAIL
jgi:hypothetical protein